VALVSEERAGGCRPRRAGRRDLAVGCQLHPVPPLTHRPGRLAGLVDRSILIRDVSGRPELADCLRVTIAPRPRTTGSCARSRSVCDDDPRQATVTRSTKETTVTVTLVVDGTGQVAVSTGLPFFNHMLEQLGRHGGFDLAVDARGDLEVDAHHSVEDVGL